jgi:hypothetical protein
MEASLQAFGLENSGLGRRVLKPLSRLRKRAGKIRDMDVLTSYANATALFNCWNTSEHNAASTPENFIRHHDKGVPN